MLPSPLIITCLLLFGIISLLPVPPNGERYPSRSMGGTRQRRLDRSSILPPRQPRCFSGIGCIIPVHFRDAVLAIFCPYSASSRSAFGHKRFHHFPRLATTNFGGIKSLAAICP